MKKVPIDFADSIPTEWECSRLKYHCKITNGSDPKTEGDIPVYGSGSEIVKYCGEFKNGPAILIGRKGTLDKPKLVEGKYWNVDTAMDLHPYAHMSSKYLYYVISCFTIDKYSTCTAKPSMTQGDYYNIPIPVPSNLEQKSIATFLDSKCEAIDQAIQKQKDIIDKLAEFRQATITQVVTHGVNSDDSIRRFQKNDYIWFDEIPQNWKTYKLKYITKLSKEKAINKENYIGLENVESKTGKFIGSQVEPDGDAIIFHQNDVLFGKLRPYLSKSLLVEQEGCCSGEFLVITPKQIVPKYLLYITLSKAFVEHVNSSTYGAKMPRSNWEFVRNMIIPLPTESEQKEIISYLDKKLASIDNVIESTNTIIQKLEEYKKSLIYNAVTGKIDCRGEVK